MSDSKHARVERGEKPVRENIEAERERDKRKRRRSRNKFRRQLPRERSAEFYRGDDRRRRGKKEEEGKQLAELHIQQLLGIAGKYHASISGGQPEAVDGLNCWRDGSER